MNDVSAGHRWSRIQMYDVIRVVLAAILLSAAVLKAVDLTDRPMDLSRSLSSHWVSAIAVELEVAVGLLLLLNLWKVLTARLTLALFVVFACVSGYKVFAGAPTCGCLGALSVPPGYMFVCDLTAVVLLAFFGPARQRALNAGRISPFREMAFAVGMMSGTAVLVWSMSHWRSLYEFHEESQVAGVPHSIGDLAVLTPERWLGSPLPIEEHLDIGRQLRHGKWVVVFYRATCQDCSKLLRKVVQEGNEVLGVTADYQVAMVQVDSGRRVAGIEIESKHEGSRPLLGRLDDSKRWVLSTPTILTLSEGLVVRVRETSASS